MHDEGRTFKELQEHPVLHRSFGLPNNRNNNQIPSTYTYQNMTTFDNIDTSFAPPHWLQCRST
jgi:hypothetical protein